MNHTKNVVLLGIGHTNAHIVRMWRKNPIPNARLICVSNFPFATYSGMLPGVLSGQYPLARMQIDLQPLCDAAGAKLIVGNVTEINVAGRELRFADQPAIHFDVLSIGVGSVPRFDGVAIRCNESLIAIKPMQTFLSRLEQCLLSSQEKPRVTPLRAVVVGGGAGGVEICFCLPRRVEIVLGLAPLELTLIEAGDRLVGGMLEKTASTIRGLFEKRGVRVRLGRRVAAIGADRATLDDGEDVGADVILWATGAVAPPLFAGLDLPKDDRGFLLTHPTLQTVADAPIFVVGDSGTIASSPSPKAGVYAVRQAPILWANLARLLAAKPLRSCRPQRGFLKLLNTGDGKALAEYKGFTFHAKWCWRLKDFIDRRFVAKYKT